MLYKHNRHIALIKEPEHPERHLIVVDVFYVVLDHKPIRDIFNLFLSLLSTSHFESPSIDFEVRYWRFQRLELLLCPAEEDGLATVPGVGLFSGEDIRHIGIMKVEFIHLTEDGVAVCLHS